MCPILIIEEIFDLALKYGQSKISLLKFLEIRDGPFNLKHVQER